MASSLADLFLSLVTVFDKASLRWYVFGAQAAIFHGAARLTADVDVTVLLGDQTYKDLLESLLENDFEVRISNVDELVQKTRILPVVHAPSDIPVDIVLGGAGLEEKFAEYAQQIDLDGVKFPIARCEDLIAMKIFAGRDKDILDTLSILQVQHEEVDVNDIRATLEVLETALDRSDLLPVLDSLINQVINDASGK